MTTGGADRFVWNIVRGALGAGVAGVLVALGGCGATPTAEGPVVAPPETFASPVARSAVRERAL